MSHPRTVLVTGATGGQGGAVARRLHADGWTVRALVRDPGTRPAEELRTLGIELVTGDLDDPGSVRAAMRDVHGVFSVQAADLTAPDPEREVRQGVAVADAAHARHVEHLVYSSVGAAGKGSGVRHFATKATIEKHLAELDVPTTVLRPVFFMENWSDMLPVEQDGRQVGAIALDPDTSMQMIALADIGRIVADVFAHPRDHLGTTTVIAGDELTPVGMAEAFTRVSGVETRIERLPTEDVRSFSPELAHMFDWINEVGYDADIAALRARHGDLTTFEDWLRARRR